MEGFDYLFDASPLVIIETRYRVERLEVRDVPYTVVVSKAGKEPEAADYRHLIARL